MFAKYVSETTVTRAGFNYWEPSLIFNIEDYICTAYISHLDERNIVVIEVEKFHGRRRREWYLGVFEGRDVCERSGDEVDEYHQQVRRIVARRNRVAGRILERKILSVLD